MLCLDIASYRLYSPHIIQRQLLFTEVKQVNPMIASGTGRRLPPPLPPKKQVGEIVAAVVARLTKAWDEYQENADYDRDAIYLYLEPVFTVVRKWKKEGLADKYSLIALKQGDIPGRVKADPYSRLLYCSSRNDDPKKRSKWAHCMQWVENHIKTGESFTQFVKRHGGINECADSERFDR